MGSDRLKIAFVINSLGSGGAERVVSLLAAEFVRLGHEVTILLRMNEGRSFRYPLAPGIGVSDLGSGGINPAFPPWIRFVDGLLLWIHRRFPGRLVSTRRRFVLRQTLRALSPDVVLSFVVGTNLEVVQALRGVNLPLIISERNDPAAYGTDRRKVRLRDKLYSQAAGAVFQTQPAQDFFLRRLPYPGVVIPNPVEAVAIPPLPPTSGAPRIVSVGRLVTQKRYDVALAALAEVFRRGQPFQYEIYGEGPLAASIQEQADALGLHSAVHLKGFSSEVQTAIAGAQLFLLSSDYEGMPNALIEAMALGLPAVATDCPVGGPASLITSEVDGILVPPGNSDAMAEAVVALLGNPDRARRLGTAAKAVADRLSVEKIGARWLDYIETVRGTAR